MDLPDIVKTILRSAAPTLLTALALPPPFNLIASSVVSGVLAKYLPENERPVAGDAPAGGGAPASPPVLAPSQVASIVQSKAADPQLLVDLRQAEADLRKYELDAGIHFAEVEVQDRADSRRFQEATGIAQNVFKAGIVIVGVAVAGMLLIIGGCLWLALAHPDSNFITAAFGLIGTAVGFINGIAATIISFYYGSSLGSKEKAEEISAVAKNLGDELGRAARQPAAAPIQAALPPADRTQTGGSASAPVSFAADDGSARDIEPAKPAKLSLTGEVMPDLTRPHSLFPGSVTWALQPGGIAVDGAKPQGTPGEPATIRSIWARYGSLCAAQARQYGVPVELIVATIATESSGRPDAVRKEPQIHDESVGLMQTLVGTARGALGRRSLTRDDLFDPATSIAAGTAYIAKQRGQTHFDPPLVAAAYNAGSLRREDAEANRWRTHCYPRNTGAHIDRWVAFFGDCMRLSADEDWAASGSVPSFAAMLKG